MSKKLRKIPKKDLSLKGGFWFLPQHDFMLSAALCQHYVYVLATTAALKRWSKFSSLECDINYVTKFDHLHYFCPGYGWCYADSSRSLLHKNDNNNNNISS